MILLFPSLFLSVYFTYSLRTFWAGPSLRQVFYSQSCQTSWYKARCCLLCSLPLLQGQVALDWGPLSPWMVNFLRRPKRETNFVNPRQGRVIVSRPVSRGLQFKVHSFWGQRSESLDPVTFFRFAKGGVLPMYLLYIGRRLNEDVKQTSLLNEEVKQTSRDEEGNNKIIASTLNLYKFMHYLSLYV